MSLKNITFGKNIQLIFIGNCKTGKTTFVNKWTKDIFIGTYEPTMIMEYAVKIYEKNDKYYKIQIVDLSGDDNNRISAKVFAKNTDGCIIFSNADDINSRMDSLKWKRIVNRISNEIPCILFETQCDLIKRKGKEEFEQKFKEFYEKNWFIGGFLISSKTGENISESTNFLLDKILEKDNYILNNIDNEKKEEEK